MQDHRSDTPVPGETIWIRRRPWRVRSSHHGTGLTRLDVEDLGDAGSRSFLIPCDAFFRDVPARHRRVSTGRALAWLAACVSRTSVAWTPGSVVQSRTAIYAFQLEPALAMLAGKRRILIADDVGLGKTIQAALMIAEVLARRTDARVLVITPASLVTQWTEELRDRFAIEARTADTDTFLRWRSDRRYLSNPWCSPGVWLASADYLKQPHVLEAIPRTAFDLVVIDEAHTVAGHSQRHAAADQVARPARHVVMLTATPHDGDHVRFNRLVSVAATGSRTDTLTVFRRTRISSVRHVRQLDVNPSPELTRVLSAIDAFARARRQDSSSNGLALICGVFRRRAISSLAALSASLTRRLEIITAASSPAASNEWTQAILNFEHEPSESGDDDLMTSDERPVMTAVTGLPRERERSWLERLLNLAHRSAGPGADWKIDRLTRLLRRTREPVVVFTEYRDSLFAVAHAMAGTRRIALLHGGLGGPEQRRALRAFLDGDADALIATDVASQGLNLQHRARWVVHFDLPWTPMRIEQRIGRVDRIGQTRTVHVTSIGIRHRAQAALRVRVARREEIRDGFTLPACRRWMRAAGGLARLFARQRALAGRWRGLDPVSVPRATVTSTVMRRICGSCGVAGIALVEIPLLSESGHVLERWLGWRSLADPIESDVSAPAGLLVRISTLEARARRRWAGAQATERAESRRLPAQPGLFHVGALDGSASQPQMAGEDDGPHAVHVRIGEPRTLVILERR